jgi:pyruvate kinase
LQKNITGYQNKIAKIEFFAYIESIRDKGVIMFHRTKIIVTIGKRSLKEDILRQFVYKGAVIFRYNFSHGSHEDALELLRIRNKLEAETSLAITLIGDIAGPEVRIYNYPDQLLLKKNQEILIYSDKANIENDHAERILINLDLKQLNLIYQHKILFMDGQICGEIVEKLDDYMIVKILNEGKLRQNAHCAIPEIDYPLDFLTTKDIADIEFCVMNGFDSLALSFIRDEQDIKAVKEIIYSKKSDSCMSLIAKFELPQSIQNMDAIMEEADAFFVARGDLALENNFWSVPIFQKIITQKALAHEKPVFIATQMLESMCYQISPNRSELNDIANSVCDKVDALTLSGETAIGHFPVESVMMMSEIIHHTEAFLYEKKKQITDIFKEKPDFKFIINEKENSVLLYNVSIRDIRRISAQRLNLLIYCISDDINIFRQSNLYWGIIPILNQ